MSMLKGPTKLLELQERLANKGEQNVKIIGWVVHQIKEEEKRGTFFYKKKVYYFLETNKYLIRLKVLSQQIVLK